MTIYPTDTTQARKPGQSEPSRILRTALPQSLAYLAMAAFFMIVVGGAALAALR